MDLKTRQNKRVFILHRWDGTPKSDWYPWLKKQLEKKGWEVIVPKMPDTSKPAIDAWVKHLQKVVGKVDKETYFIGHSIGCQAIMRYLATLPKEVKAGGIIFVAGWFTLRGLESKEIENIARPWLEMPINFEKIKEKTNKIIVFLSDDDGYVDLNENKALFRKNLNAMVIVERGKRHFTAEEKVEEVPEVLQQLDFFARSKS